MNTTNDTVDKDKQNVSYTQEEMERNLEKAKAYFENIDKAFAFYYWRARRYQERILFLIIILSILTLVLCLIYTKYFILVTMFPISLLILLYAKYQKTRNAYKNWSFLKYKDITPHEINFYTRL